MVQKYIQLLLSSTETVDLNTYKAIIVTDDASSDWSNVTTILSDAINNEDVKSDKSIFIVDNGTDARVYLYQDDGDGNGINVGELTEVATLTGVNTQDLSIDDILL